MIVARNQESVSMGKSAGRRGASFSVKEKKPFLRFFPIKKAFFLIVVLLLIVVVYASFSTVKTVLNVPVNSVDVVGDLVYLKESDINQVIDQYVVNGFVSVDLNSLRSDLLALPWVYKASIERSMDNGLVVRILEQKSLAYWNEDGMINEQRSLFFPVTRPAESSLPHLFGRFHKSVLGIYDYLCLELPVEQLPIKEIKVADSNIVKVRLLNDAWLIFNASEIKEKIKLWKRISAGEISTKMHEIEYVDLRYSNGASVKWKAVQSGVTQQGL